VAKIRRAGYVFIMWKGDHGPKHVHVYRNGKSVLKWDLESRKVMKGRARGGVLETIFQLESEGLL